VSSPECERAVLDAFRVGTALLKVISPNDVGLTRSHQYGYYLPKEAWQVFTPYPPEKDSNSSHDVEAVWPDGRITRSCVKWYGNRSRSEYRITRFGNNFPYRDHDCVGSLLILVPERVDRFLMHVLDLEDDIDEVQAALGVELVGTWTLYQRGATLLPESEDDCIRRCFRTFTASVTGFPSTTEFARKALDALTHCIRDFVRKPSDEQLVRCVAAEYDLYRLVERKLCEPEIVRVFGSVEDFLSTAQTILQRRKSRAGRSLENHVERLLRDARIPFDVRVDVEGTKPDVLIPGKAEYEDTEFPDSKLFAVGVKTTCKDRWRQVLREAPRVRHKHILTLQKGISPNQMDEMRGSDVTLVVPEPLHDEYPKDRRDELVTVEAFIEDVRAALAAP